MSRKAKLIIETISCFNCGTLGKMRIDEISGAIASMPIGWEIVAGQTTYFVCSKRKCIAKIAYSPKIRPVLV